MESSKRDTNRDARIWHMRKQLCWSFRRIGEELNISKSRARQLYVRVLKEMEEKE